LSELENFSTKKSSGWLKNNWFFGCFP